MKIFEGLCKIIQLFLYCDEQTKDSKKAFEDLHEDFEIYSLWQLKIFDGPNKVFWKFCKDVSYCFVKMNKIKILKDLLRVCTHMNLDHKPLYLSTSALPLSYLSLI